MTKEELEHKIAMLEDALRSGKANVLGYEDDLKTTKKKLEDINKPEITPLQFDLIQEAIEKGVDEYDFSDTSNFDIEYGIEYDGKVHCESHEINCSYELVEMITAQVHRLFKEAECPTEEKE
jgi:hypothetical protein